MDGALNCSNYNSTNNKVSLVYDSVFYVMNGYDGWGKLPRKTKTISNPFGTQSGANSDYGFWAGSASTRDSALGWVRYSVNFNEVWLRICFKLPCSDTNNQLLEKYRLE